MMNFIKPQVFLIGESTIDRQAVQNLLETIGSFNWTSDAKSDIELLTEIYGRSCYLSFGTELNQNITHVRKTNKSYLENIIEKGDGSVLEHGVANFYFVNVSRIFTHELVRHRVGIAISQESLRFVRLPTLDFWIPPCLISEENGAEERIRKIFSSTFEIAHSNYIALLHEAALKETGIYDIKAFDSLPFEKKKIYTSAARRILPEGLATNIGWSCNIRSLRHIIEQRTAPWAEEEMRLVFNEVADIAIKKWPNLFGDYTVEMINGFNWYQTKNRKV